MKIKLGIILCLVGLTTTFLQSFVNADVKEVFPPFISDAQHATNRPLDSNPKLSANFKTVDSYIKMNSTNRQRLISTFTASAEVAFELTLRQFNSIG